MYCSHCGSSTADDLNYCKNCGSPNERHIIRDDARVRGLALSAAGGVGVVGIVGFYFILRELMVNALFTPGYVLLIMVAYLIAVLMMFAVFVRSGKRENIARDHGPRSDRGSYQPPYVQPARTARLNEPRDNPASVTEHTTRALEEVPVRER